MVGRKDLASTSKVPGGAKSGITLLLLDEFVEKAEPNLPFGTGREDLENFSSKL